MAKADLTAQRLRELVHYDPEVGAFWSLPKSTARLNTAAKCRLIGGVHKALGYVTIGFGKDRFYAHRLALLYMTGEWPKAEVDHINGDRSDNRFANLRDVDRATNAQNRRSESRKSAAGLLGVTRWIGAGGRLKWVATIKTSGQRRYLGVYETPELAHEAYLKAKRDLHGGCTI